MDNSLDLEAARAARNHVPRPEGPTPDPRQAWLGRLEQGDAWHQDQTSAAADEPARQMTRPVTQPQSRPQSRPKIWDLEPPEDATSPAPVSSRPKTDLQPFSRPNSSSVPAALETSAAEALSQPLPKTVSRPKSERVKTRLLGFQGESPQQDVLAMAPAEAPQATPFFPIGWLVVVEGAGRGASFTLTAGLSTIGRDAAQTVSLDFGDTSISRDRHAAIAYDPEENRAYIGHGGKSNIVRHNDKPLLTTEELQHGDLIKIGKTVLQFVAFCGPDFAWEAEDVDG